MKRIIIVIFILISINSIAQQEYTQTIRGTVIDKSSMMTLPGASIVLLNSEPKVGTTTDANGNFKLENIPLGRQGIQVSFIGYNSVVLSNLNLTSGKEVVLNIELEEQVITTEEVVITAKQRKDKALNKMATVSARSFTVEETERFAGSLGDPSRMVANYAGVAMTNDSRNDIIIRGNSPIGLLWRLDGIEIPNPNHFGSMGTTGGPVSMLNNNLLTNSDFFTSAFPAEYGNAISGVFDLKMRTGNNEKREYLGQIGFNGFELGAEGPFIKDKKGTYLANYRYSTLGAMHAIGLQFGTGEAIPQYQDLSFKLDFPGNKLGRFSIIGMGGLSYIELNDSEVAELESTDDSNYNLSGVDLNYGSDMGFVGLSHLYFINEKTRIQTNLTVLGSRSSTDIDSLRFDSLGSVISNSNYKFYESKLEEIKYSISTHLKKKVNVRNNFSIGMYYDIYEISLLDSVLDHKTNSFRTNYDVSGMLSLIRAYTQWQHKFNDKIVLNAGIYSHYADINSEITVEPRVGIKYNLTNTQSLSLGYGLHSQMQPRMYYFMQSKDNNGAYVMTNEKLKMTKAHQFVLGYDKLFTEDFRFKTEVYYQSLFDIPVSKDYPEFSLVNSGDDFYSNVPDSMVNEGTGANYGVEFTIEKFFTRNYYFLSTISLFESKYEGYDGEERNTAFNGNYIFNILFGYEFKLGNRRTLSFGARGVYGGGKRYIPIDIEQSILSNYTEYDWTRAFDDQFDPYFRTDLRISLKVNAKKVNQEWAIDLQNLTNNKNIYKQSYNVRKHNIGYDYQSGFFPMFLYRIQF